MQTNQNSVFLLLAAMATSNTTIGTILNINQPIKKKCFRVDYTTTEPFSEHLCDSPLNLFLSTCAIQLLFSQPQNYTMSSIRRHLASEQGPVPITPAMDPDFQVIVRAGNQGVHEKSSIKRKRAVKGKKNCLVRRR